MAFPIGWTRQCAIVNNHAKVGAGGVTSFPSLVTEVDLPSEMLTTGGVNAAQANGGDIRFSSDALGASQLACEVEIWTQNAVPASAKAVIWVQCTLSSAADTTIYVWYNAGGSQTQPAASAAFGSQAVWDTNYKGVWHLPNGTVLTANDSTSNAINGALSNAPAAAVGQIDGGASFNGTTQSITLGNNSKASGDITVSGWVKRPWTTPQYAPVFSWGYAATTGISFLVVGASAQDWISKDLALIGNGFNSARAPRAIAATGVLSDNTWHFLVGVLGTSTAQLYLDGVALTMRVSSVGAVPALASQSTQLGNDPGFGTDWQDGTLDEVRVSLTARSAAWISTEFNNQNSPSTFWTVGTPISTLGNQGLLLLGCGS